MLNRVIPIFFLLFVLSINTNLRAQGTDNKLLPVLTLPSPEAAALGKYGVWPISQYTGLPSISVPVYNISINGFSLPVTLNYHAGGVKIDDKASWVGTNWSLNAGGMIGRTVIGLADEDNGGLLYQARFGGVRLKTWYDLTIGENYRYFLGISKNTTDSESDIYYYNFAGFSGQIIVDSNYNVRSVPVNNLKFLVTPFSWLKPNPPVETPPYYKWIIADANGNIYKFGGTAEGQESSSIRESGGQITSQGITALYLAQIILANKADTINFDYDAKTEHYALPYTHSCRAITKIIYKEGTASPSADICCGTGCGTYDAAHTTNETLYNGMPFASSKRSFSHIQGQSMLRKITWRGGQVEFKGITIRQDMLSINSKMLDSITVSNSQGTRIKSMLLEYAYVNGRYYLDSLKETGSNPGAEPLKYGFGYINRNLLPPSEPMLQGSTAFNPNAQDHWGYYNAATSNQNLLPPDYTMPSSANFVLTSNRKPDTTAMQYGTLNKISYPTGGYTKFEYEANKFDASSPVNPTPEIIQSTAAAAMGIVQPVGKTVDFSVAFNQTNVNIAMHFNDYAHPPNKRDAVFQYVRIDKLGAGGSYTNVYYWDAYDNFPSGGVSPNPRGFYDFDLNSTLTLTTGTYRLIVNDSCPSLIGTPPPDCLEQAYPDPDPADDTWIIPLVNATITYHTYQTTGTELRIAGGLRAKEIVSFTENSVPVLRKKYEYAPGKLLMYPGYSREYERITGAINSCYSHVRLKEVSGSSQTILGFTQGAAVGYTNVKEWNLDMADNNQGYTSYNFSFIADSLNLIQINNTYWLGVLADDPTFPVNSFEYKRGLLLSKTQYKRSGVNYVKVDSLDNKYDFNDFNSANHYYRQRNLRVRQLSIGNLGGTIVENNPLYPGTVQGSNWEFSYVAYDRITSWVQQLSSEHIIYDQNGTNPLTNLTKYYYDNPEHMLATRVETTDSKGMKVISHTSYPQDYASGTTFIDDMVAQSIIGAPIENVSYQVDASQNVEVLKGTISVYKTGGKGTIDRIKVLGTNVPVGLSGFRFSNTSQGLLPSSTSIRNSFIPDSRYTDRVLINSVNAYGSANEQQKVNDAKEVYFWGYKGLYPVAKLIGTDYSTAQSYITQSILDNALGGIDDEAIRTELNKLRNVPGAMVTTFTYKPLIGITSQTDPSGKIVFYEYDTFGRLKLIKDLNGKILKLYDYQYKASITQ